MIYLALRLIPGDDEDVITRTPVDAAPRTILIAALHFCLKEYSAYLGIFFDRYAEISVCGL